MVPAQSPKPPAWWGLWAALVTAVSAALSLAVGATTPARSEPNCRGGCIGYPYRCGGFPASRLPVMYPAPMAFVALAVFSTPLAAVGPVAEDGGAGRMSSERRASKRCRPACLSRGEW
jgi:hypothetical protein